MKIFIFDLDGVLVNPRGYHLALKETVRLAGESLGYLDAVLTDSHIARFESLGISSEWHSSALSMGLMQINKQKAEKIGSIFLPEFEPAPLFEILSGQDLNLPALERGLEALKCLADRAQVSPEAAIDLIINSESIKTSPTFNWFQEMILGTDGFENTYGINGTLETSSFLKMYDHALLSKESREKLFSWLKDDSHFASIMTNRPSSGPPGFSGAPDAGLAAELAGVENLPLVGYGEIQWLAQETNSISGELCKPNSVHALAAIILALGYSLNETTAFVRSPEQNSKYFLYRSKRDF